MRRMLTGVLLIPITALLMSGIGHAGTSLLERGKASYKAGRYSYAIQHLQQATRQSPKNSLAHFYLGMAYARSRQAAQARGAFQQVIEIERMKQLRGIPTNTRLVSKAKKNLAVTTKTQIKRQSGGVKANAIIHHAARNDNYLTNAIPRGQVIHWNLAKMPIKIYIQPGHGVPGWHAGLHSEIVSASGEWYRGSQQKIRFKFVTQAAHADMVVHWQKTFSHGKIGINAFRQTASRIVQSDIRLATHHPAGRPLTSQEIRSTALHELGHALGIQGHSPYPNDVMFFSQNPRQRNTLTARDIKTIQLLYAQKADVTNRSSVSTKATSTVYNLINEARPWVTRDPARALALLSKAQRLDPRNTDVQKVRGIASYNLGVNTMNAGVEAAKRDDRSLARNRFQQAVGIFERLSHSSHAPQGTQQKLAHARSNLRLTLSGS